MAAVDGVETVRKWQGEFQDRGGKNRVLGIVGPPGVGKSTLVGLLCAPSGGVNVGASFLFKHDDAEACSVRACIFSIARQFGLAFSEEAFDEVEDMKTLFHAVLSAPLRLVSEKTEGMVVVLDGLDEADDAEAIREIVVEMWEKETPTWLGVLFTSRPMLGLDGVTLHKMSYDRESSAIKRCVRSAFKDFGMEGRDLEEAIKVVAEQSAGFPVYADAFLRVLSVRKEPVTLIEVCRLLTATTKGELCDAVYEGYFRRLLENAFEGDRDLYRRLLSAVAVSRFPLERDSIVGFVGGEENSALEKASEFLCEDERGRLEFSHESMKSFLLSKKRSGMELHVPAMLGHEQMVDLLMKDTTSPDALHHLVFHLCGVKDWDTVRAFMLDFEWLVKLVAQDGAAEQVISDLDAIYNYSGSFADIHVTDVVRGLELALFYSQTSSTDWNSEWLAFQLLGRIADQSNPVLESCRLASLFVPRSICLEPARSGLRKALKVQSTLVFATLDGDDVFFVPVCQNSCVQAWNKKSGACLRVFQGPETCLFSRLAVGGDILASLSIHGVTVWDRQTGACLQVLEERSSTALAVSKDGQVVVSVSYSGTAKVWDWPSGTCLHTQEGHHAINVASIDGDMVASFSEDGSLRVWRYWTGDSLQVAKLPRSHLYSIALCGDLVVFGTKDKTVNVWNWRLGSCLQVLKGHSGVVVAVDLEDAVLVSSAEDWSVRVWNWQTGVCLQVLRVHLGPSDSVAIQGNLVLFRDAEKAIKVWDISQYQEVTGPGAGSVSPTATSGNNTNENLLTTSDTSSSKGEDIDSCVSMAFSSSGDFLVSGSIHGKLRITNSRTRECTRVLEGPQCSVLSVGFAGDDVVGVFRNGIVNLWEAKTGILLRAFEIDLAAKGTFKRVLQRAIGKLQKDFGGHSRNVTCAAMDGNTLVSGSDDVRLWDIARGKCFRVWKVREKVDAVAIDANVVVWSVSWEWTIKVCDRNNGSYLHVISCSGPVSSLDIAGDLIFGGTCTGVLHKWDGKSSREIRARYHHSEENVDAIYTTTFWASNHHTPVAILNETMLSAHRDKTIRIWNGDSLKVVASYDNNENSILLKEMDNGGLLLAVAVDGQQHAVLCEFKE